MTYTAALTARIDALNSNNQENAVTQKNTVRNAVTALTLSISSWTANRDAAACDLIDFGITAKGDLHTYGTHAPRDGAYDALIEYIEREFPNAEIEVSFTTTAGNEGETEIELTAAEGVALDRADDLVRESLDSSAEVLFDDMMEQVHLPEDEEAQQRDYLADEVANQKADVLDELVEDDDEARRFANRFLKETHPDLRWRDETEVSNEVQRVAERYAEGVRASEEDSAAERDND